MKEHKHTPLPWNNNDLSSQIYAQNGDVIIGASYGVNRKFDNAFIVRACNNHYELLDALKTARKVLSVACGEEAPYIKHAFSIIDPAIAKAEGGAE